MDRLNLFQNGCLLLVHKNSSVSMIEEQFKLNMKYASIPIYLLINRFKLKNLVYINHATMKYDTYKYISIKVVGMHEGEEESNGHYPVSIVYNGPSSGDIHMGMHSSAYTS